MPDSWRQNRESCHMSNENFSPVVAELAFSGQLFRVKFCVKFPYLNPLGLNYPKSVIDLALILVYHENLRSTYYWACDRCDEPTQAMI
jgi:hypothetical protein